MLAEDIKKKFKSRSLKSPSVFLGYGSPMSAIDFDDYNEAFTDFLGTVPYPRSILVVSPFWETEGKVRVTGSRYPDLIYDFEGGPDTLKLLTYPCSGNPDLAESVMKLLNNRDIEAEVDFDRGLDKGVWVPIYVAFPELDVPIIQVSVPTNASSEFLFKMGTALSDLRKTGTMILVTGNTVHEDASYDMMDKQKRSEQWARDLDNWISERVESADVSSLYNITSETLIGIDRINLKHLAPLYIMMGTLQQKDHVTTFFDKFYYGNTSQRSFAFVSNE